MARPAREIDLEQLTALASVGLTQSECAAILKCSPDTIQRRPELVDAYNDGMETCKASLRRKQFEIAMKGNVTALIWLGKNLLGQSDKTELTGRGGEPLFAPVDREELIGKLLGTGSREAKPTVQ